jgi:hypothetical protein
MARVYTPGKMAGNMKENMKMTENTVTEFILGTMASNTQAGGLMANSMARESTEKMDAIDVESGKKARESSGLRATMVQLPMISPYEPVA